jgi:hypothetical protein
VAEKWKGDGTYFLPAGEIEPYRLWFEFLKLAMSDPEVTVDHAFYEEWGDVQNLTFKEWWGSRWRQLFAVQAGVRRLSVGEMVQDDTRSITLNIPLSGKRSDIQRQIDAFLMQGDEPNLAQQGRFQLTQGYDQGFIKQMDRARRYLRLYDFWMKHRDADRLRRVEGAARDYAAWYAKWEPKVRKKGSKLRITPIPLHYKVYASYLEERAAGKRIKQTEHHLTTRREGGDIAADDARKAIGRDLKKARNLAANVGRGEFPGRY